MEMSDKVQADQVPSNSVEENQPKVYTKSDYIKAKAIIQSYRETQKSKPKRPCSEKQLAALKAGREKAQANRNAKKAAKE